jgi:hypothetical protein
MEFIDRLVNFYDETADVYETENGNAVVILEGSRQQHNFVSVSAAIEKLYKMGYRF